VLILLRNEEKRMKRTILDEDQQRRLPKNAQVHIKSPPNNPSPRFVESKKEDLSFQPAFAYEQYVRTYAFSAEYEYFVKLAKNSQKNESKLDEYVREMKVDPSKNVLTKYGFILPENYKSVASIAYSYINLICEMNGFYLFKKQQPKNVGWYNQINYSQQKTNPTKAFNLGCAVVKDKSTNLQHLILVLSGKKTEEHFYGTEVGINEHISGSFEQDSSNNKYVQQIKQFMGDEKQFHSIKHVCDQVSETFTDLQKDHLTDPNGTDSNYFYGCSEPVLADECAKFLSQSDNHVVEGTVEFYFAVEERNRKQVIIGFHPQKSCQTSCQAHAERGYYKEIMRSVDHNPLTLSEPRSSSITSSMSERLTNSQEILKSLQEKKLAMEQKKSELTAQLSLTEAELKEARKLRDAAQKQWKLLPRQAVLTENERILAEEMSLAQKVFLYVSEIENHYRDDASNFSSMEEKLFNQMRYANRQIIVIHHQLSDLNGKLEQAEKQSQIREINKQIDLLLGERTTLQDEVLSCSSALKEIKHQSIELNRIIELKQQALTYQSEINAEKELIDKQKSELDRHVATFNQNKPIVEQAKSKRDGLLTEIKMTETKLFFWECHQIQSMEKRIAVYTRVVDNLSSTDDAKQDDSLTKRATK